MLWRFCPYVSVVTLVIFVKTVEYIIKPNRSVVLFSETSWRNYVYRVKRCKYIVTNHINTLTDNERENNFHYCNHYNVYFNVSIRSRDLQTSRLGLEL